MNYHSSAHTPLEKDDAKLDGFDYINHLLLKEVNINNNFKWSTILTPR